MNISPIAAYKFYLPNIKNKNYTLRFRSNKSEYCDIFVNRTKENKINKAFDESYEKLKNEASEYILNSKEVTRDGLFKILEKYCPDIYLTNCNEKEAEHSVVMAQYINSPRMEVKNGDARIVDIHKEMQINIPDDLDYDSRLNLLLRFIHESTHMLQNESNDKTGWADIIERFIENIKSSKELYKKVKAIEDLDNRFFVFENCIFEIIEFMLNNYDAEDINPSNLNRDMQNIHGLKFDEAVKVIVDEVFYKNTLSISRSIGRKNVAEYIRYKLLNESEAYRKEYEAAEELNADDKNIIFLHTINMVLDESIKALNKLIENKKF